MLIVNLPTNWQLGDERERELQTLQVARAIEAMARGRHVVLAADLNAEPHAASIRFLTGRQSLDGASVCYRDAWETLHPEDPGHTFTPRNPHVVTGEGGVWRLETGRRIDYVMVRCHRSGPTLRIAGCERIFDEPVDGVWGSDHFGVVADLEPV
jgi:endonuclease/exonuclease/phosphatase family metal-dependent hydrolase